MDYLHEMRAVLEPRADLSAYVNMQVSICSFTEVIKSTFIALGK